ncbi:MAG: T9SS type A sorting domain-containing protein [Calditrichaeota bacterium]|nr:T9SS type A sorting domain-containing protein [Calditrichota bacterium]
MRRFIYASFVMLLAISFLMARDLKVNKMALTKGAKVSAKIDLNQKNPLEPMYPYAVYPVSKGKSQNLAKMQAAAGTNRNIATSGNGYGWLNPMVREIDRYAGLDADLGTDIDFIAVSYRGADASQIMESEVDVSAGLATGTLFTTSAPINDGFSGVGGRYPCMVALDRPFVSFNQYVSGDGQTTPTISHPYTMTSWGTYGANGDAWTTPDFQMDVGWLNPTLNSFTSNKENRLWNGPVSIVKDASDYYRYVSVYETWYSDVERSLYGVQNEKYIFNARSISDYAADGWVYGWDEGHDPVWIDTAEVSLPRCGVSINSSGFGVIAGPGHLGWHHPDSGYYYNKTKITYSITTDYGLTWSAWDTVEFVGELGIPGYIHGSDKWIMWDTTATGDTIWYDGPAFVGTNFDMSVMVDDNNTIYVAFNSLWGVPGDNGWYPNYRYSGVLLARKPSGGSWVGSRIAYNNGIWQGDDYISGMSNYFFDSEVQISRDEMGNLYASWLDRRHNQVQISNFNRYSDPETYGNSGTFKTDIYAAHSIDGGDYWSDPINLTDTPALDEYELNMSIRSANQNSRGDYGKIWYAYCLADTASGDPATDSYIELSNAVWVGEASNFNPPAAIGDGNASVVRDFALRQNYPNPFNPTTTIEFVPLTTGKVTLTVYNAAGQEVANLFNGEVQKNRPYQVIFSGQNLASGIYFYQLKTEKNTEIKKMVLIK